MKRTFVIVLPSLVPSGPVKGAIALANQLIKRGTVYLITLKSGPGAAAFIDCRIHIICLSCNSRTFFHKVIAFRSFLQKLRSTGRIVSISMCFSADLLNSFCFDKAVICSSIRGNLPVNYRMDYGFIGLPLAYLHLFLLRRFSLVTVMSQDMCTQVTHLIGRKPEIIGNFIDETSLDHFRHQPKPIRSSRFVFVGSLTTRKRPELLIYALKQLHQNGHKMFLDIIGTGPLEHTIRDLVHKLGLSEYVFLHGHLDQPYSLIRSSDALVLPSMSEGISRAAMEALYLGTPCILRRVDGNHTLIDNGINGILFDSDSDLPHAMIEVLQLNISPTENLLPSSCSQEVQSLKLLCILDTISYDR